MIPDSSSRSAGADIAIGRESSKLLIRGSPDSSLRNSTLRGSSRMFEMREMLYGFHFHGCKCS